MQVRRTRPTRLAAVLFAGGLPCFLAGCFLGPNSERIACLQSCARQKDTCILKATGAETIQQCDGESRACNEACP
jgi:hypothetical protein